MNDPFEKKVRAAAFAGWWVILIGFALLTLTWVVYLVIVSARPAWMLAMWGQNVGWDFMQVVSLWFLGVFKLFLWILVLNSSLVDAVGKAVTQIGSTRGEMTIPDGGYLEHQGCC